MFEKKLGYKFTDKNILMVALTRTAAVGEGLASFVKHQQTFSRLKFLGVHVLSLLISDLLFATDLFDTEGGLTLAHSRIMSHNGLITEAANQIDLGNALIIGKGERLNAIQYNDKVLFSHMQALFGAIWMDCKANYIIVLNVLLKLFNISTLNRAKYKLVELPPNLIPLSKFDFLQAKLGYLFDDTNLLLNAVIRQSALEENILNAVSSFQTLEFLGDKVLGCVAAEWLLSRLDNVDSDVLTPLFNELINNTQLLPKIAQKIKLGEALIIGAGEELVGVRSNQRKLADHVEALMAALWLDVTPDYKKARACIIRIFKNEFESVLDKKYDLNFFVIADPSEFPPLSDEESSHISGGLPGLRLKDKVSKSYKEMISENPNKEKNQSIAKQKILIVPLPFWQHKDKEATKVVTTSINRSKALSPEKTVTLFPRHTKQLDITDKSQFPSLK